MTRVYFDKDFKKSHSINRKQIFQDYLLDQAKILLSNNRLAPTEAFDLSTLISYAGFVYSNYNEYQSNFGNKDKLKKSVDVYLKSLREYGICITFGGIDEVIEEQIEKTYPYWYEIY